MENISVVATGIVGLKEKKNPKTGAITKAPFIGTSYGQPVFTGLRISVTDTVTKANGETAETWICTLFTKAKDMKVANQLAELEGQEVTVKGWLQTENLAGKDETSNYVSFFYVDEIVDNSEPTY